MKAKVINQFSNHFEAEIDVKLINYRYVFGIVPSQALKVKVPFEDVNFIYEHEWEKSIVKHRALLNISLPKAASLRFYAAVSMILEERFKDGIKTIYVLKDINEKARKKYWYKRAVLVVNNAYPIFVSASGREFTDNYNINIEDTTTDQVVLVCKEGICRLKEMIGASAEQMRIYQKVLNGLETPGDDIYQYKAIEGR